MTSEEIEGAVLTAVAARPPVVGQLLIEALPHIVATVKRARYINLYDVLGKNIEV